VKKPNNLKTMKINFDGYYSAMFCQSKNPSKSGEDIEKLQDQNNTLAVLKVEQEYQVAPTGNLSNNKKKSKKNSFRLRLWFKKKRTKSDDTNSSLNDSSRFNGTSNRRLSVITEE
jgi:hypothetical protein